MTLKELQQKIADSPNKEFYQNYKLEIKFTHVKYFLDLTGVASIYEYILKQISEFDKHSELPHELTQSKKMLIGVRDNIALLIERGDPYQSTWNNNVGSLRNDQSHIFLPDFPETEFLIKVYQHSKLNYQGAFEYLKREIQHHSNRDYFEGYLLAYEFVSKDFSGIAERKESEKKSILTTRTDFQKKLGEAENEVVEYIGRSNEKFNEYVGKIDVLKNQKEEEFVNWFKNTTADFKTFNESSFKRVKDLEDLYFEKLKLEAPAQYWNKRAAKLRKEGIAWLLGMIICLVVSISMLVFALNIISNGTLQRIFSETSTAIKWSVVFITLISFLAYGLRTFAKLTFSSFHLVRDAEEREQLTYVYLALQKEKGIDQTERHLIMQSLFSRADSGLLKDDSGPTMPGNIAEKIIQR
ncbi:MAG: DUF6161 domain-containing protein [Flavihumibacter sp.]|nr:DUF6161 domain-containing protein [Flavihumibacter sp.]